VSNSDGGAVWFIGTALVDSWSNIDGFELTYHIDPISLSYEVKIDEKMSWGLGMHAGYISGSRSYGIDYERTEYTHIGVFGRYFYHFLPRESMFSLAGVGTLGYTIISDEYESELAPSNSIKIGVAGHARVKLGKKFGFFSEIGYNGMAGHVQLGIALGRQR